MSSKTPNPRFDAPNDPGRRRLLLAGLGFALLPWPAFGNDNPSHWMISPRYRRMNGGLSNQLCWTNPATGDEHELALDFRGHGLVAHPGKPGRVIMFARRPGDEFVEVDLNTAQVTHRQKAGEGLHFYGHGAFSPDGRYMYSTENRFADGAGVVRVRDGRDYSLVAEYLSGGIGPHDLRLLSDGHTVVVANGGIRTHPDLPRKKLNIDSMQPNLSYLDMRDGRLLEQHELGDHQLSIRHLGISSDDLVVAIQQYEGRRGKAVDLVAFHRLGQGALRVPQADERTWRRMNYYTASAAADTETGLAVVTCPHGNLVTLWDTQSDRLVGCYDFYKPFGAAVAPDRSGFLISTAGGELHRIRLADRESELLRAADDKVWDNHLIWI